MQQTNWELPIGAQVTPQGVRFRVWASQANTVAVVLFENGNAATIHSLNKDEEAGYWSATVKSARAGTRYAFSIDGGDPRPDPASRYQPDGVHAPSQVVDPRAWTWNDKDWNGPPLEDLIIHELHVGTATPEGTFDALIARLPYFRDLGVTALEIMPIADFPGTRNWGYDGVDLYAPANAYGGPEAFKRLVDAAHGHGLAIILDVVYNHFGPDGNYLRVFSPDYFTEEHHTPWGAALNLDQPGSEAVRNFLIGNALYWAHEYHVDGLRLDATHALIDDSPQHLLQQLNAAVCATLPVERHFMLTAEDERNDERMIRPLKNGGYGLDAVWADDFHHQVRVGLTGEQGGYLGDYTGSVSDLLKTIRSGWFYQGEVSQSLGHERGTDPYERDYGQFIYCIQNHDQIGNRPVGDRLNHTVDAATYRAVSAMLLLVPETPLLFQGQEWAASTPFQYFTDHNAELGKLVTEGRTKEFAYFHTETGLDVPDPQAEETFTRSKLDWNELAQPEHAATLTLYRDLIALRRSHPALRRRDRDSVQLESLNDRAFVMSRSGAQGQPSLTVLVNLGKAAALTLDDPRLRQGAHRVLLDTNATQYGGAGAADIPSGAAGSLQVTLNGPSVIVIEHNSRSAT